MLYIYLFFKIPEKKVWILITLDFIQPGWVKFCDKKKVSKSNVQFTNYLHKHLTLTNGELIA